MNERYLQLSREELYEIVWETPAVKLSDRFNISGRGLAKLCERHEIPVPERGWWARKAAGQDVEKPALKPPSRPYMETVTVQLRDDFRQWLTADEREFFDQRLAAESSAPAPAVPEVDDSRHPLVRHSRPVRRDDDSSGPLRISIRVTKELRERALRIVTALVEACEARGYRFVPKPGETGGTALVEIFGHGIGVAIEEPFVSVPHVLTKSEAREQALGRGWSIPKYDTTPSGELSIILDHAADGERRSFSRTKERDLEAVLPDVMKALVKIAMRLRAERNRAEDVQRRAREAAELRRQEELRRREEQTRVESERRRRRELLRDAARFRQAAVLDELIAAVQRAAEGSSVDPDRVAEWVAHARLVAESLNPVSGLVTSLSSTPQSHASDEG